MSDCLKSADGVVLFADGAFHLSIERGTRTKFAPEKSSICIGGHCTKKNKNKNKNKNITLFMYVFVLLGMPFRTPISKSKVKKQKKQKQKQKTKTHQKTKTTTICYHSPPFQISSDIKEHICWHRDQQKLFTSFNNGLTIYVCSV